MPEMPPLSDAKRMELLSTPLIAKLATHGTNDEIRITAIWFGLQGDGSLLMNTWDTTAPVRNIRRSPKCSMLIDTPEFPYAGVHLWGTASIEGPEDDPDAIGRLFAPYRGDLETATSYAKDLIGYGVGKRVFIRFRPEREVGWDFARG
jgi:hypothetical protein